MMSDADAVLVSLVVLAFFFYCLCLVAGVLG